MKNKLKLLSAMVVLALIAVAVKWMFFTTNSDEYFARNYRSLQEQVPGGLIILRPTHFPFLKHEGIFFAYKDKNYRMLERNAPLSDVIAAAYDVNPARVVLPPGAPKVNYDFLVTTADKQRERLQAAIRQKLGCTAQKESRETDVLALKVVDANPPGLTLSGANERPNGKFNDIKITFKHLPLLLISLDGGAVRVADGLEQFLGTPVVDKTGLTNRYDYSMIWDLPTRKLLQDKTTARAPLDKTLAEWGLRLEPDTASLEMLVVKKVQ